MLKVVEVFESIQGEVPTGKYALFIRLYGCNRNCTFCDTKYAVNGELCFKITADNLEIPHGIDYVVITGGEPLIQKIELEKFVKELKSKYPEIKVALETNGDIRDFSKDLFDLIVVSPKDCDTLKYWVQQLHENGNVVIKVVDKPENEKLYINLRRWVNEGVMKRDDLCKIYIMPFGSDKQTVEKNTKRIIQRIKKYGLYPLSVAPRLHIMLDLK